jgi:hypothetical protein
MWAALVVIPLAAMAVPIALILLAVLFDVLFVGWWAFRMWHDEWAVRVGSFLLRPFRGWAHSRPVPRSR